MSKQDGIGTWWWYNLVEITGKEEYDVPFSSNGLSYSKIAFGYIFTTGRIVTTILYDSTRVYLNNNGAYNWEGGNGVSKFQYIKFDTAPPPDLLAKLQANATYQEPKLTDLTGTTWKWNEILTKNGLPLITDEGTFQEYGFPDALDIKFLISGSYGSYVNLNVYIAYDNNIEESFLDYINPPAPAVNVYNNGTWADETFRTISITGGTDATNTDLINYLYANAELQGSAPVEPTYKLRINGTYARVNGKTKGSLTFGGATYKWDNTSVIGGTVTPEPTDELLGTWVFNETINIASSAEFVVSFSFVDETSDNVFAEAIAIETSGDGLMGFDPFGSVYSGGWMEQVYRTITITDTSTLTNRDEFTTWLKANAVKQSGGQLTDLTNTTWKFNGTFAFAPALTPMGDSFAVDIIVPNTEDKASQLEFNEDMSYLAIGAGGWWNISTNTYGSSEAYNVFTITGGTDVTNKTLIDWLNAHAVKQ